jgi:uncharacterized protein
MSFALALLDDMATLAKLAAVSLDDAATQAVQSTTKAAGIVIDDAATAPQYVAGIAPSRELPMIGRIAAGSLKNKAYLTGGLVGLSYGLSFTPIPVLSVVMPVLMAGGGYLAYEGYEKFFGSHEHKVLEEVTHPNENLEKEKIQAAIRTDLILSAEIMAMTFGDIASKSLGHQAGVLGMTGLVMTVGVYGVVALLVKGDDLGLLMAKSGHTHMQKAGRGLVRGMSHIFNGLSIAGAAAMLWVGGGMLVHGAAHFGFTAPEHLLHDISQAVSQGAPVLKSMFGWAAGATASAVIGLAAGAASFGVYRGVKKFKPQ